jgi:hypothetical protein
MGGRALLQRAHRPLDNLETGEGGGLGTTTTASSGAAGTGGTGGGGTGGTSEAGSGGAAGQGGAPATCAAGPAYLHGNVWPFWYNYRVSCDLQHKQSWLCHEQGGDCTAQDQAWSSCNVCDEADGICIPRTAPGETDGCCDAGCGTGCCDYGGPYGDGEDTCFFGYYRSCRSDCDTRDYDYVALDGHFYGKGWSLLGDWSIQATDASTQEDLTGTLVIGAQGQDHEPSLADTDALGYFGCVQIPTDRALHLVVMLHDWGGQAPYDRVEADLTAVAGRHYVWGIHGIEEWTAWDREPCVGPPAAIAARLGGLSCGSVE